MEHGEFDLAAVGRALLSDPAWCDKTLFGNTAPTRQYHDDHVATLL
jgi:2,4-dienoyl-CoA reductase-like NADH-dependent reductase (Old Yellow Enzyme family)